MSTKSAVLTTCAVGAILIAGCGGSSAPGNIAPTINDTPPIVWTNSGVTMDLTAFASDIETPSVDLVYSIVTQPDATDATWGSVGAVDVDDVFTDPTAVTYTPGSRNNGVEYFTFMVSDGISSDTATVWIGVNNDAPTSADWTEATVEEVAVGIDLATGGLIDLDGDPLLYELVTGPLNGTLSAFPTTLEATAPTITYTPNVDFPPIADGLVDLTEFFTFTVTDMVGTSAIITVDIDVTAVNDAPVAQDFAVSVPTGGSIVILLDLFGSDADGDPLTYWISSLPSLGTLNDGGIAIAGLDHQVTGELTYDAPVGEWGEFTFTYYVNDGTVDSATATVTINVAPPVQACWGWGRNNLGQLGLGIGQWQERVEYAKQQGEPRDYVMVDGGVDHSVYMAYSLADTTYFIDRTSGSNEWGQLGRGPSYTKWPTPLSISGTAQTQHAGAGNYHTLAAALREFPEDNVLGPPEEDYGVWGAGQNMGRLGNGLLTNSFSAVEMLFANTYINDNQIAEPPTVTFKSPKPRFTMVAGGLLHSIALDTDGDVWAVGSNANMQLSLTGIWVRRYALKINSANTAQGRNCSANSLDADNIVKISARQHGNLALNSGGGAYFWGSAGTGWQNQALTWLGGGWQDIAMGGRHILLISGGLVYSAGANEFGQLGNGTTDQNGNIVQQAIFDDETNLVTNFVQVAAGGSHSLALTADGRVFACGDNTQGQCGTGITGSSVLSFKQVRKSATPTYLSGIIYIGAGGEHSLAVDTE